MLRYSQDQITGGVNFGAVVTSVALNLKSREQYMSEISSKVDSLIIHGKLLTFQSEFRNARSVER